MQTVETLIRLRILQCLIWICTVCNYLYGNLQTKMDLCFVIAFVVKFPLPRPLMHIERRGWLDEAKVSCSLHHQGNQLRLAYSWARPAAGKGSGEYFYFFCLFTFIHYPLSPISLSFISSTISSGSLLPFPGR